MFREQFGIRAISRSVFSNCEEFSLFLVSVNSSTITVIDRDFPFNDSIIVVINGVFLLLKVHPDFYNNLNQFQRLLDERPTTKRVSGTKHTP